VITGGHPFAHAYLHQAMVAYAGEKMSKSKGNLVLVSALREDGVDPMAVRLSLLGHRHHQPWEWHDSDLEPAIARLGRWREAFSRPAGPAAPALVTALREALRGGLDTPAAVTAVDAWAAGRGNDPGSPQEVAAAVDALLGIV
jgi:L-cysteine:1D-myo-inositol 2-amino-2-deoxy-alpha-D-glucopyranoside ligase